MCSPHFQLFNLFEASEGNIQEQLSLLQMSLGVARNLRLGVLDVVGELQHDALVGVLLVLLL